MVPTGQVPGESSNNIAIDVVVSRRSATPPVCLYYGLLNDDYEPQLLGEFRISSEVTVVMLVTSSRVGG